MSLSDRRAARRALLGGALGAAAWPRAFAAVGGLPSNVAHDASSPQWEMLREKLFGKREMVAGDASAVQLVVPLRAAFGASVPVKVVSRIAQSAQRAVRRLTLIVDKNPSPVAATIDIGTQAGQADFETRLRVDEYSHVRVIAELSDGSLHTDSRYAKVSGGCSAPSNRGPIENIGRTVLRLPEPQVTLGSATPAELAIAHPNDTGFELNERTLLYIPAYFVRSVKVSFAGRPVFDADLDFSISENPSFRFCFVPNEKGELRAEIEDSKEIHYSGSLAVG